MMSDRLHPTLPFHEDEITQAYFARVGYFHAGVDVGRFCHYFDLSREEFRDGADHFINAVAAISGIEPGHLHLNTIQRVSTDTFSLRGEILALPAVRRVTVRFCPRCLMDDAKQGQWQGQGAWRFRWSWLLKSVVACPIHRVELMTLPAPDGVKALDLQKLFVHNEVDLACLPSPEPLSPGELQQYVVARLVGPARVSSWLDRQGIAQGVRACEMVGSLISDGPTAEIKDYSELDWARVGNVGFHICSGGRLAILDALTEVRLRGGRRSGRTGPQAAFGRLFTWLKKTERAGDEGPIRDVVRDAIIENFAIDPGETVLGQVVQRRKVHSVNSLTNATGLTRYRLYRVMRKAGMIPEETDGPALNQWVFPADDAERMIARVLNSIPQNQVRNFLGCSRTQAVQLVQHGLITSVVPMSKDGRVGLTRGDFNRDDLSVFLDRVTSSVEAIDREDVGYADLTSAARPISSTAEILGWQIAGELRRTRLLDGVKRLDHLRFCRKEVRQLVDEKRGHDLHRLTAVTRLLGTNLGAIKRLVSQENGGPWLIAAGAEECRGLHGNAYVSAVEIERFRQKFLTVALVARWFGMNHRTARRILEQHGIQPVIDPVWLGTNIYVRQDVARVADHIGIMDGEPEAIQTSAENGAGLAHDCAKMTERGSPGEFDASLR